MMQYKDRGVTLDRLSFLWEGRGYRKEFKLSLKTQIYTDHAYPLTLKVLRNTGAISFDEAKRRLNEYVDCRVGDEFGNSWDTHWFHVDFQVPKEWNAPGEEIHLRWNSSSEAMVFGPDGKPLQGLTGGSRDDYVIYGHGKKDAKPGDKIAFFIEMACCGLFGNFRTGDMLSGLDMNKKFKLKECRLARFDRETWELLYDYKILMDSAKHLESSQSARADEALVLANQVVNICKPGKKETYGECKELIKKFLQTKNSEAQHTVYAVGHCHIDMAWLWPFSETRRKGGRSWSSQTEIMKQYKTFSFCASTAGLYEWVQNDYPLLFEEIKKYNKEGRFQHVGGAWLEFDGYVPSGESMARQMLYGQRFFKQHFGSYCDVFFLPDTFGYSAQLPQIIRLGGMKYFLTQKISWNRYNKFPHSSFYWKGIDGTNMLTHFPPADTYCGNGELHEVLKSQTNFKDKGRSNSSLYLFGVGDGGGGPTFEMVDKLSRMEDIAGIPKVKLGSSVGQFFKDMEASSKDLLSWDGELYLELHNGTYTTQANNKKYNRMCEFLMRDAEMFAALRSIYVDKSSKNYPKDMFDEVWKKMMLFHFHDVLPGTCIRLVYEVTDKEYPAMVDKLRTSIGQSTKVLAEHLLQKHVVPNGNRNTLVVFNSLTHDRKATIEWVSGGIKHYTKVQIKALGCAAYPERFLLANETRQNSCAVQDNGKYLEVETQLLKLKIAYNGKIHSIKDKTTGKEEEAMREVIAPGEGFSEGNTLCIHNDVPLYWDAWDLWIYYQESKMVLDAISHSVDVPENGDRICIDFKYSINGTSSMTQTMVIYTDKKKIDFRTVVDWHEEHKILRVYFPLNLRSDFVTCDIQSGNLRRPTTANTSWEMAKYEVCSHKFVDYSEGNYGVALLNDCKYGYSARGNLLGMSLLKSSKAPSEVADMGRHEFTYSLYMHEKNFEGSDVGKEALELNIKVHKQWLSTNLAEAQHFQFVEAMKPNVVLDAFKLDEEERKHVVVRVHEDVGAECYNRIGFGFEVKGTAEVNILEEPAVHEWELVGEAPENSKSILKTTKNEIYHKMRPFQILTFKVSPSNLSS